MDGPWDSSSLSSSAVMRAGITSSAAPARPSAPRACAATVPPGTAMYPNNAAAKAAARPNPPRAMRSLSVLQVKQHRRAQHKRHPRGTPGGQHERDGPRKTDRKHAVGEEI